MSLRNELWPWDSQPQEVAEPISGGEFSGPALLWNAATPRINLANKAPPSGDGTGVTERVGPFGREADFSGAGTGRLIFPTAPEQDAVTFAIEARIDSVTDLDRLVSGFNGAGYGKYDIYVDGTPLWVFQVARATTNAQFRFAAGLGSTFRGTLVISYVLGSTPEVFFNGAVVTVSTLAAGSGATVASSDVLCIGGRADVTTRQVDGGISQVWRADRAIPAAAARELSRPGAMAGLLYEPRRIILPVSAAGGGTWSVSLSDTASATDSLTAAVDAVVALLDAASASDLLTAAAVVQAVISDLAGASDTSTATFEAAGTVTLSDLASATDSLTCAATLLVTLADSAAGTDAYTAAAELVRTLTDTASATDSITASIPGTWDVTLTELAAAVDVIAVAVAGGEVLSAPPLVRRLESSIRIARTSASRSDRLQSRNR